MGLWLHLRSLEKRGPLQSGDPRAQSGVSSLVAPGSGLELARSGGREVVVARRLRGVSREVGQPGRQMSEGWAQLCCSGLSCSTFSKEGARVPCLGDDVSSASSIMKLSEELLRAGGACESWESGSWSSSWMGEAGECRVLSGDMVLGAVCRLFSTRRSSPVWGQLAWDRPSEPAEEVTSS